MLPQRIILVRHGQTAWNCTGRFQGHADPGLNGTGQAQAKEAARRLAGERVERIYTSDLTRAVQTSQLIALTHGLSVRVEPLLREIDFGRWEGLTFDEIQSRSPDILKAWMRDPFAVRIPGGETAEELKLRVKEAWNRISGELPAAATVLIVAHGGSLRMLTCLLTRTDTSRQWEFDMGPGESAILFNGGNAYARVIE